MRVPTAVLVFGPPGSGKSTQAALLADTFAFEVIDMGLMLGRVLREPAHAGDPVYQAERARYDSGQLVSTSFFADLVHAKFREVEAGGTSVVLGGWPRSVAQAEDFMPKLIGAYGTANVFAFVIDIPEEVSRERSAKRLTCSVCSRPQLATAPASGTPEVCRVCGGALFARTDAGAMEERLAVYYEETVPLYAYLQSLGLAVRHVSWAESPDDVHRQIVQQLGPNLS